MLIISLNGIAIINVNITLLHTLGTRQETNEAACHYRVYLTVDSQLSLPKRSTKKTQRRMRTRTTVIASA
jgi:hypothetical protein